VWRLNSAGDRTLRIAALVALSPVDTSTSQSRQGAGQGDGQGAFQYVQTTRSVAPHEYLGPEDFGVDSFSPVSAAAGLELYLRRPSLEGHVQAVRTEGRPLADILGCSANPGTVVVLAADVLRDHGEAVAALCAKLGLGFAAFAVKETIDIHTNVVGKRLPDEHKVGLDTWDGHAPDAATQLRQLRAVAGTIQRGGQSVEHKLNRHRSTCKVASLAWQLKMTSAQAEGLIDTSNAELVHYANNIKLAAAAGERFCDAPAPAPAGWTPLHFASRLGSYEAAANLVAYGADPNVTLCSPVVQSCGAAVPSGTCTAGIV